jgi:hypothetical protein
MCLFDCGTVIDWNITLRSIRLRQAQSESHLAALPLISSSCLEPYVIGYPIAFFGHLDIFYTESLGLMSSPLDGDLIVHVGPRRMVVLELDFVGNGRHELPSF